MTGGLQCSVDFNGLVGVGGVAYSPIPRYNHGINLQKLRKRM